MSFEESRRRGSRDRKGSGGRNRDSAERRFSGDRSRPRMTKVTCSTCGKECEVPFKPTSNKPVYCSECFGKKDNISNRDLDIINEKLNKIMKALKIQ